jgi:hypothetical protein
VNIGFTLLEQFTSLSGNLLEEVDRILPIVKTISTLEILMTYTLKDGGDSILGSLDIFDTHRALQDNVCFTIIDVGWNDTRTINEIDTLHQGDVLPNLGLTRDGGNRADLFGLECVDDGRFTSVGVSNETHRDLLAVTVKGGELTEKLDQ